MKPYPQFALATSQVERQVDAQLLEGVLVVGAAVIFNGRELLEGVLEPLGRLAESLLLVQRVAVIQQFAHQNQPVQRKKI